VLNYVGRLAPYQLLKVTDVIEQTDSVSSLQGLIQLVVLVLLVMQVWFFPNDPLEAFLDVVNAGFWAFLTIEDLFDLSVAVLNAVSFDKDHSLWNIPKNPLEALKVLLVEMLLSVLGNPQPLISVEY